MRRHFALILACAIAGTLLAVIPTGAQAAKARLIVYKRPALVTSVKSANRHLKATPRHFRSFIGKAAAQVARTPASYCGGSYGFGAKVRRYDTRGFALVHFEWCDTYEIVYKRINKRWRKVASDDRGGGPSCAALRRHKVPSRVLGTRPWCMNAAGKYVRYSHR